MTNAMNWVVDHTRSSLVKIFVLMGALFLLLAALGVWGAISLRPSDTSDGSITNSVPTVVIEVPN